MLNSRWVREKISENIKTFIIILHAFMDQELIYFKVENE